jgi:hypothetical protein
VSVFLRNLDVFSLDAAAEIEVFLDEPIHCLPRELQRRVLGRLAEDPLSPFGSAIGRALRASEATHFTLCSSERGPTRSRPQEGLNPRDPRTREILRLIVDHYFKGVADIPEDDLLEALDRHVVLRVETPKNDE